MQTYRLIIGPDGAVKIPDGQPGQVVTVLLDTPPQARRVSKYKPVSEMTGEEREAFKKDYLERGQRIRERLKDQFPIDHGAELYGEDGLPR